MKEPTTYYEWIQAINYIKDKPQNDLYIETLKKGTLDASDDVIMKICRELSDVIRYRTEKTISSFMEYLKTGVDYNGLSLQIIKVRKEFNYSKKLVYLDIFPKDLRDRIADLIQKNADRLQETLVTQTKNSDRSGILNSLIKQNPINRLEEIK